MHNVHKLKAYPIAEYLQSIGVEPVNESGTRLQYFSPLHSEKTPSFWVDTNTNTYKDFGLDEKGGDIIDLVQRIEKLSFKSACERVKMILLTGEVNAIFERATYISKPNEDTKKRLILSVRDLQSNSLINYCKTRGISEHIARLHLSQVHYLNPDDSKYTALGMRNKSGGMEIRYGNFKACIGNKDISVFGHISSNNVSVFEGMFDFLSMYEIYGVKSLFGLQTNIIVLHSVSMVSRLELDKYDSINTYFDNDDAGKAATVKVQERYSEKVNDCSLNYPDHNDLNDFLCQKQKK